MSTTAQTSPAENKVNQPPAPSPAKFQEETIGKVLEKVNAFQEHGQLVLPKNYIAANALQSAYLVLQETVDRDKRPVLQVCSKASVANALLEMVVKGLNPIKKQCYFVAYGNELVCEESYFGKQMWAKRVGDVKEIRGFAVYAKDVFKYERKGKITTVLEHTQDLTTIDPDNVLGAYAIIEYNDGRMDTVIMNIKQIRSAWAMGAAKGTSPAHKSFADEMAIKTVVNRACKVITNSTDDADLLTDDELNPRDPAADTVRKQIAEGGNKTTIGMTTPAPHKTIPVAAREIAPQPVAERTPDPDGTTGQPDVTDPSENEPPY